MKRFKIKCTLCFSALLLISSCNNSSDVLMTLVSERDSLINANDSLANRLYTYDESLDILYSTLDSIAIQENQIFKSDGETPLTKDAIRYNLERYEALLRKQESKIHHLESTLSVSRDSTNRSQRIINQLKAEIRNKDQKIKDLLARLDNANTTVEELQGVVNSQKQTIANQNITIAQINDVIIRQDKELNKGYVLIASRKEIKQKGIAVKKGRARLNAIEQKHFHRIDIRTFREITFQAKRPRILTDIPSSTYELTTAGDGNFTLTILDATKFWDVYNYLIIQTD